MPVLHSMAMWDICTQHMQNILDQDSLSHTMLEHIRNLFRQMYKYAIQYELVAKNYSQCTRITKENGDTQGRSVHQEIPVIAKEYCSLLAKKDDNRHSQAILPVLHQELPSHLFRKKSEI